MNGSYDILIIGGSAGSLEVIMHILPELKKDFPLAIVIVTHRSRSGEERLPLLLSSRTMRPVKEAEEKETINPGTVYVAPADYHLLIEHNRSFSLDVSERVHHSRPSIDVTFESASLVYGPRLVCLLLSGANADGAEGLMQVKRGGGLTITQNPITAEQGYMPQQAMNLFTVDLVLDKKEIAEVINGL